MWRWFKGLNLKSKLIVVWFFVSIMLIMGLVEASEAAGWFICANSFASFIAIRTVDTKELDKVMEDCK